MGARYQSCEHPAVLEISGRRDFGGPHRPPLNLGNATEATKIAGRPSDCPLAGKLARVDFRLLQQYPPDNGHGADVPKSPRRANFCHLRCSKIGPNLTDVGYAMLNFADPTPRLQSVPLLKE